MAGARRGPGRQWRHLLFVVIGRDCPICNQRTERIRTPWYWRPLRWLLWRHSSTRLCYRCSLTWFAIHARRDRDRGADAAAASVAEETRALSRRPGPAASLSEREFGFGSASGNQSAAGPAHGTRDARQPGERLGAGSGSAPGSARVTSSGPLPGSSAPSGPQTGSGPNRKVLGPLETLADVKRWLEIIGRAVLAGAVGDREAPTALNAVEAWLRVESEHMTRQAVEELRAEVAWLKGRALAEPPLRKVP